MLEKIITWSIHNKVLVILVTILAIGFGVFAVYNTPVDALPDLSDISLSDEHPPIKTPIWPKSTFPSFIPAIL